MGQAKLEGIAALHAFLLGLVNPGRLWGRIAETHTLLADRYLVKHRHVAFGQIGRVIMVPINVLRSP